MITILVRSPQFVGIFTMADNSLSCIFVSIIFFFNIALHFVIILIEPFNRLFINLTICIWAIFHKTASTLDLVDQTFWRMPFFTKCIIVSSFDVSLPKPSIRVPARTPSLGFRDLDAFLSFCCMKEFGDGFDCVIFPR